MRTLMDASRAIIHNSSDPGSNPGGLFRSGGDNGNGGAEGVVPAHVVQQHVRARREVHLRRARLPRAHDDGLNGSLADAASMPDAEPLAPPAPPADVELMDE